MFENFLRKIAPYVGFVLYSLLTVTWRKRYYEPESLKRRMKTGEPFVIAHWHHDEVGAIRLLKRYRACPMISQSKDGAFVARVAELMGSPVARGSSSRGGVQALKAIIRLSRAGWRPSIAVDGPRGPIYKAKPGALEVAKVIRAPIYCLGIASDPVFISKKAWNRVAIPHFFARVIYRWSEEFYFDENLSMEDNCLRLEAELNVQRKKCFDELDKRMDY